jgi:hypothetical protein
MARGRLATVLCIWVAVLGTSGSLTAGVLSQGSDATADTEDASGMCLVLMQRVREWATDNPADARLYLSVDRAGPELPDLWSREERQLCGDHPERLIQLNPPDEPTR